MWSALLLSPALNNSWSYWADGGLYVSENGNARAWLVSLLTCHTGWMDDLMLHECPHSPFVSIYLIVLKELSTESMYIPSLIFRHNPRCSMYNLWPSGDTIKKSVWLIVWLFVTKIYIILSAAVLGQGYRLQGPHQSSPQTVHKNEWHDSS